ncbi:unnamed protein product [Effrenium voratum]|nr:unnamed protein product [Effrenium voratum]
MPWEHPRQRAVVSFPSPVRQGVPWCFWGEMREASKRVARETVIPKFHMRVQSCSVAACCGPRSSNTFCRNEFLDMHLSKLEEHDQEFDSAFLYQLQVKSNDVSDDRYTLLFQRTEQEAPKSAARAVVPQKVRHFLRLDWNPDGLAFDELNTRLPENLLVESKVFHRPLRPAELGHQLEEVQNKTFDIAEWNSNHFCQYLIAQVSGKAYQYRR